MFPALFPLLFTVVFALLHLYFGWKNGPKIIVYSFATTAVVILANYIIKTSYLI